MLRQKSLIVADSKSPKTVDVDESSVTPDVIEMVQDSTVQNGDGVVHPDYTKEPKLRDSVLLNAV